MSNKFEQLLDLLVNEEMDKANELFHEIVVEKSREIYENMIAEEADDEIDEEMDDDLEEGQDEAVEEETTLEIGGDSADDFMGSVSDKDAMGGMDDMGGDADMGDMDGALGDEGGGSDEQRISDLESELEQLKSEFEALMADEEGEEAHNDGEDDPEFGDDEGDEEGDEEGDDEEGDDGNEFMREYVETVSAGHGADKKGRGEDGGTNTKSVGLQNPKGRPTTTASAHNILGGKGGEAGIKGGEGLVGGIKGEFTKDHLNKPGGYKGDAFGKNSAGHGAEGKSQRGEGRPVGAATGGKAAQTGAVYTKSPADRMQ
jgi:hypothetical protein